MKIRSVARKAGWLLLLAFLVMNVIAFMHAYRFTHFSDQVVSRTKDPTDLTLGEKLKIVLTGIDNPKPTTKDYPTTDYDDVTVSSHKDLRCWRITALHSKGTVIMFHGYAGEKSSLLERSERFVQLGYNVLLVDFTGSGESDGSETSIGYHESQEVKACYDHVLRSGEKNILLFGTSMGAAAILKALYDYQFQPSAIILECPFGSLYKTVCARFDLMNLPSFPMAGLLTFWGGVQHGYWAFGHNPAVYAKAVTCPALLIFGEQDNRVSREETDDVFRNMKGQKYLKVYPEIGHDVFILSQVQWSKDIAFFISEISEGH